MLKLKRLKINKFRHVVPTELVFDDRYNVPLGINGSGKTTLLKLISACLRSDFSEYKEEELDVEYELSADQTACRVQVTNIRDVPRQIESAADPKQLLQPALGRGAWRASAAADLYVPETQTRLTAALRQNRFWASVDGSSPQEADTSVATCSPTEGSFLPPALWALRDWLRESMKVEQHEWDKVTTWVVPFAARHECYRFDESLITFGCMVGTGSEKAIDAPPKSKIDFVHSWHVNIRRWEVIPSSSFVPEELVESIARGFADSDGQIDPKLPIDAKFEARPSFVAAFLKATMLPDGHATLETIESRPSGEPFLLRLGDLSFRFRTKGGGSIGHDLLSYGQKRLLSFLYYVACNDTFIVADELVNGLHHAWIEVCLDAIGERQAFLTSQNPILLDFVPPTSPEQAERRFIRCVLEEREGRDVMVWRNLTPDEATELCKQYAVGIQQLSELLRVNGLW